MKKEAFILFCSILGLITQTWGLLRGFASIEEGVPCQKIPYKIQEKAHRNRIREVPYLISKQILVSESELFFTGHQP